MKKNYTNYRIRVKDWHCLFDLTEKDSHTYSISPISLAPGKNLSVILLVRLYIFMGMEHLASEQSIDRSVCQAFLNVTGSGGFHAWPDDTIGHKWIMEGKFSTPRTPATRAHFFSPERSLLIGTLTRYTTCGMIAVKKKRKINIWARFRIGEKRNKYRVVAKGKWRRRSVDGTKFTHRHASRGRRWKVMEQRLHHFVDAVVFHHHVLHRPDQDY